MSAAEEGPAVEAIIERTVWSMTANALQSLRAALAPLKRRETRYRGSPVYKALEEALRTTEAAGKEVEKWRIRTAPQADAFDPQEGEGAPDA